MRFFGGSKPRKPAENRDLRWNVYDFGSENKSVKSIINNAYGTLPIFIRLQGEAVSVVPAGGAA